MRADVCEKGPLFLWPALAFKTWWCQTPHWFPSFVRVTVLCFLPSTSVLADSEPNKRPVTLYTPELILHSNRRVSRLGSQPFSKRVLDLVDPPPFLLPNAFLKKICFCWPQLGFPGNRLAKEACLSWTEQICTLILLWRLIRQSECKCQKAFARTSVGS